MRDLDLRFSRFQDLEIAKFQDFGFIRDFESRDHEISRFRDLSESRFGRRQSNNGIFHFQCNFHTKTSMQSRESSAIPALRPSDLNRIAGLSIFSVIQLGRN